MTKIKLSYSIITKKLINYTIIAWLRLWNLYYLEVEKLCTWKKHEINLIIFIYYYIVVYSQNDSEIEKDYSFFLFCLSVWRQRWDCIFLVYQIQCKDNKKTSKQLAEGCIALLACDVLRFRFQNAEKRINFLVLQISVTFCLAVLTPCGEDFSLINNRQTGLPTDLYELGNEKRDKREHSNLRIISKYNNYSFMVIFNDISFIFYKKKKRIIKHHNIICK